MFKDFQKLLITFRDVIYSLSNGSPCRINSPKCFRKREIKRDAIVRKQAICLGYGASGGKGRLKVSRKKKATNCLKLDVSKGIRGILLGLKYVKVSQYDFLKAFLEPYHAAEGELEKRLALQTILENLEKHLNMLKGHREFSREVNSMILDIIKKSEAYRNHLFITKIWNG